MDNTLQESQAAPAPGHGRRRFLNRLWALLGFLACLEFGWLAVAILRSGQDKQRAGDDEVIITVGNVHDFTSNSVTAIPEGRFYLACLEDGSFLALSRTCTHLGCSIPWDMEAQKFICPCHGSSFDITGAVLTPPASRPLPTHPLRIENGVIRVNIAKTERPGQDDKPRAKKA